jgi:GLPGLI family protein
MRRWLFFCVNALLILIHTGCSNSGSSNGNSISEGVILYDATPLDQGHPFAAYAPSKMTVKFKDNTFSAYMSAGMGALTASFISDPENRTFTQIIRLFSEKYYVVQNEDEIKKENNLYNVEIEPTNETKVIAGYTCKKAIAHFKGEEPADYPVYYTNEINAANSNFSNPYFKLDGVLMEYRMKKFGLEMQFTATKITKEKVEDDSFEVPDNCKQISQEELTDKLKAFE